MCVPLIVMCAVSGDRLPFWNNFMNHMEHRAAHNELDFDVEWEADQELNRYQAYTNWRDDTDPVWFPDQEQLTHFVLTYS